MSFYGADIAALRGLATAFQDRSAALDALTATLRAAVTTTPWAGPDADALRARWYGEMEAALRAASGLLDDSAQRLRTQAQQQEGASAADGGFSGGVGGAGGGGAGLPSVPGPPGVPESLTLQEPAPTIVATEHVVYEQGAGVGPFEGTAGLDYRIDELSDGTYRVTQLGGVTGGVGEGTPTPYAEGHVNEHDVNLGGQAGASGGAVLNVGTEYTFQSQAEVEEFLAYQQRQTMHYMGPQLGAYEPPAPTATIVEGGAYATGSGGAAIVPMSGGSAEVTVEGLVGTRVEQGTGLTTIYVRGDAGASIEGTGMVPGSQDAGGPGVYAVTYDAKGNVVANPPSSLVTTPPGGTVVEEKGLGFSAGTPLPVVGGGSVTVGGTRTRTEYP
jgi:hypothetical protein